MAEKSDEEVVSTQQRLQSSHDPGWNDPPKWAFTPSPSSTGTPKKRLLNKRVAFPLSSTSASPSNSVTTGQQLPPSNLPPPPVQLTSLTTAPHAPLLAPTGATKDSEIVPEIVDKEGALNKTLENIQTVINHELEASRSEEVQKRLEIMKNMWDKFDDTIQGKILKISEELRDKDIDAADKLHVSLMMNHTLQPFTSNTWISGIRHLILELRVKNAETQGKAESDSQPIFLSNPTESE